MSPSILGAALVTLCAALAAFVPQRLLEDAGGLRSGTWLWLLSATVGLAMLFFCDGRTTRETAIAMGVLAAVLTAMAVFDARRFLIPDVHVAAIGALGLSGVLGASLTDAALGAALGGGLLGLVRWFYRRMRGVEGLGLGDVKLALALGALAGPLGVVWIILGGAVIGLVYGLIQGGARTAMAPFGTAMAVPALAVTLYGHLA